MQPRLGQVPPSRSGSIIATVSPASRVAAVTPMPGLPLSPDTPGPVIAETSIRYHRPLVYADEILVTARTVRLGRTSFEMEYAVWRDGLCALGRAVLILVINATGEKAPLPPDLRERILARDPAAAEAVIPGLPLRGIPE